MKYLKVLVFLYLLIIALVSLISFDQVPKFEILSQDKPIHFLMYFGLSFFLSIAYNTNSFDRSRMLMILVFSFGFGVLMEILQELLTSYRSCEIKDVIANALGSIVGIIFAFILKKNLKKFLFRKI